MIVCFDATKVEGYDAQKDYRLNIRKEADPASEVIGAKEPDVRFEVDGLDPDSAFASLAEGGYAMAQYLKAVGDASNSAAESLQAVNEEAGDPPAADLASEVIGAKEPDLSVLQAMSHKDLVQLARDSGINVRGNASSQSIIEALMADED